MKKFLVSVIFLLATALNTLTARAATLYDWAFYIDGSVEAGAGVTSITSNLDQNDLGTLSWTTGTPGNHTFIAFLDYEIDEATNTYFNENGAETGTLSQGQSWEIDEPGYVFGDIYDHLLDGNLDNANSVPQSFEDDVSIALGWDFTLEPGFLAFIEVAISTEVPLTAFYLSHTDPDSDETIYFSSSLTLSPVPEPGTAFLFAAGMLCLTGLIRRRRP